MADKDSGGKGNVEHSVKAPAPASLRVLRLPQVCRMTGLCRSMIYQLEAERRFPHRIKIGVRAVGWLEDEVQAWLSRKIAASRPPVDASTSTAEP
jgi:prophage regulatory protein